MDPGHVVPVCVSGFDLGDDLIEMHRRRVQNARRFRRLGDDRLRHQRTGIQADRAGLDQPQAAHGDEIRIARPGADEMNGHAAPFSSFLA